MPGDHPHDLLQAAHLAHLFDLVEKILQGEAVLADLLGQIIGLFLVDGRFGLFDQGQDIAHPQNPRGHPVGMKNLQGRPGPRPGRRT
jgi:hypothetical protein